MSSSAAAKKHFQEGHRAGRSLVKKHTEGRGGVGEKGDVFGIDSGAGWGAELEEPALGSGGSCAGLGPGCQRGKGWKLQGLRGLEKGLQRVRN